MRVLTNECRVHTNGSQGPTDKFSTPNCLLLPSRKVKKRRHLEQGHRTNTHKADSTAMSSASHFFHKLSISKHHPVHCISSILPRKKPAGAVHGSGSNLSSFLQCANNREGQVSSMQKEPRVVAVAIGCKQLSLHNRCVSSVCIAGGFHVSPHSTVPLTSKALIHGLKKP